jgi:hypothetical protein
MLVLRIQYNLTTTNTKKINMHYTIIAPCVVGSSLSSGGWNMGGEDGAVWPSVGVSDKEDGISENEEAVEAVGGEERGGE